MAFKEKIIGVVLIVLGALPFLLGIESINTSLQNYGIATLLNPGEIIYQVIIIILGALLLIRLRGRQAPR